MKLKYIFIFIFFNIQSIPKNFKEVQSYLSPIKIDKNYLKKRNLSTSNTSLNWAGYVVSTNINNPSVNSVDAVVGSWNVPVLKSKNSLCVIWIGIDGYLSKTIEQIGTAHEVRNGQQIDYAWFSMSPNNSFLINDFTVRKNDSITASVKFQGNNQFVLQIINNTLQQFATVPLHLTKNDAQRLTAQWIVEANSQIECANFHEIQFSDCQATINNVKQSISSASNCILTMVNSTMVKNNNEDISQARVIVSDLTNQGKNFKAKWLRK
jgi:hypothetical protein